MLGRSFSPVIGKLAGGPRTPVSGCREPVIDGSTSPRSPLELKSPRCPKSYDLGVVGLAIVAALEKSCQKGGEFPTYRAVHNRNSNPAIPISVDARQNSARLAGDFDETVTELLEEDEEYTLVTCHGRDNESYTRVYSHRDVVGSHRSPKCSRPSVFKIAPARISDCPGYPDSDFLNSCHMCQKNLHGKDIYMYRGEKAFCSTECRYRQIVIDEYNEKCSSEISRSADVSSSPCSSGQMFSTGILAL